MKRYGFIQHMIDFINDMYLHFKVGEQRETDIFKSSSDYNKNQF